MPRNEWQNDIINLEFRLLVLEDGIAFSYTSYTKWISKIIYWIISCTAPTLDEISAPILSPSNDITMENQIIWTRLNFLYVIEHDLDRVVADRHGQTKKDAETRRNRIIHRMNNFVIFLRYVFLFFKWKILTNLYIYTV